MRKIKFAILRFVPRLLKAIFQDKKSVENRCLVGRKEFEAVKSGGQAAAIERERFGA